MKKGLLLILFFACALIARAQGPGQQGDGIWIRNAAYGESQTFDSCNGHQPGSGQYHHHIQPICLRAQLNDNLVAVKSGRTGTSYREKAAPWTHSPILGWAFDGYPIYGPYGYSDPANPASAVKRMQSGFRPRTVADRTTLPAWALAHHTGVSQTLSAAQYGPVISDEYPLGRYVEDFEFVQGSGDLDQYNGRFAVTPEYPNGTYAYFTTLDQNGAPAFPYIIGMQYYGVFTNGRAQTVPAAAREYFNNGQYTEPLQNAPALNSWFTKNSQQQARVASGWDPSAGSKTTWPVDAPAGAQVSGGVSTPALADTQRIRFSDMAVYVNTTGLASYTMGPWFDQGFSGGVFGNWASTQNYQMQISRAPTAATTKTNTGMGAVGMWVNGVPVFNVLDGASYSNAARSDAGGGRVQASAIHVSSASFEGGPTAHGALMTAFPMFGAKLATAT
ncbi:MAG: YHYH protein, partial [Blastocatellia bacterium]